jgi:hypothetical protein
MKKSIIDKSKLQINTEPSASLTANQIKEAVKKVNQAYREVTAETEERNVRITIDIPESLYLELKTKVVRERKRIREVMLGYIQEYVSQ